MIIDFENDKMSNYNSSRNNYTNKKENYNRYACGGYYRFEFDNSVLLPHPYQESICW